MKFCVIGLLCIVAGVALATNAPNFGNEFPKFQINNPEITWAATNRLRPELWTYKVVPQSFSAKGISVLLHQSCFTNRVSANVTEQFSLVNKSNTCTLRIVPSQGWIKYWNESAPANYWDRTNHLWEQVEGLPNEVEVERLGLRLLNQFGIRREDLAQRADGHLITFGSKKSRSYFDRRTQKYIDDEVTARGIFFDRRIDGVDFAGIGLRGGCNIEFGNHEKISEFNLVWRNLQPYENYKVASQNEVIQYIREGKAVLTHKNLVNPAEVKSITITDITPLYMGASGDVSQEFVYPFAQVNGMADLGYTNVDIQLYCPVLSSNIMK